MTVKYINNSRYAPLSISYNPISREKPSQVRNLNKFRPAQNIVLRNGTLIKKVEYWILFLDDSNETYLISQKRVCICDLSFPLKVQRMVNNILSPNPVMTLLSGYF